MTAICGLVIFAVSRRRLFPFLLASMYTAFFYLIYVAQTKEISLDSQVLFAGLLSAMLFDFAIEGPRRAYSKRFCAALMLGVINLIFMYQAYRVGGDGVFYMSMQITTAITTALISMAEFYFLLRLINGYKRGAPIIERVRDYIMAGLCGFGANKEALPPYIWQSGTKSDNREKGIR